MAAPSPLILPRLRDADAAIVRWAEDLVRAIEAELQKLRTAVGTAGYTVSNVTETRTLDPTTATLPTVAQVLGTLLLDGKKKGTIA